ncbi:hypothetical protein SAMN03080606_01149 [Alkaliphilus peptidifermentans DSM 18978]|uniref:Uncharacterized protein n=1 Tax=Alkaliphilus peptidifermentans DSM 18978 TaxID=1120976 RepID=A0A1G5EG47_9FIRM|nr:hypothetical protein SAMN03080606_01149 [Alkaliphilus peptidifermentans DSM 18978]
MTQILRQLLTPGTILHLHDLYEATTSVTFRDRHNCRGCLSSLQRRGLVVSLGGGLWKGI